MASANVLDIFTCGICLETFDESSKYPRMLSCGHSFCHSCLGKLLVLNPRCPTCRAEILFESPESIPINYSLKSLINIRSQILMPNTSTNLEGEISDSRTGDVAISGRRSAKKQIPVDLPTRHLPQTREALGTLCQSMSVYAVEDRYDGTRYGKVALKDGRILVASFKQEKPEDAILFALPELLSRFNNGSSELPERVFLRMTPDGERDNSFEVIIKTYGGTPRAKNFVLYCSALKGPSYKGVTMYGSFFCYLIPSAPPPLLERIRNDDYKSRLLEGGVYGMWEGNSGFAISLCDHPTNSNHLFGLIIAGLQWLKDFQRNCFIEECGLVI